MIKAQRRPEEMTLAQLKDRAKELGIEASQVAPTEADGDAPVKADWLREVLKAEGARNNFKPEWRDAGTELVALFGEVDESEVSASGRELAANLASGSSTNADLVRLRDAVKTTAAALREADRRDLATRFSHANYHVRRAERATMLLDREVRGCRSRPPTRRLVQAFGGKRASAIDGSTILSYERKRLRDDGAARATVNQELATLRRMFNLAVENGLFLESQKPRIKTPNPRNARQGFFEDAELAAILEELPDYLRPVIRFGYYTGWRVRSEVLPMRWSQVDFEAGMVRLEPNTTKNNEGREFPFAALPGLKDLLEAQRVRTRALEKEMSRIIPWVFHREGERIRSYRHHWEGAREAASTAQGDGATGLARTDLSNRLVLDLRRTAVRNLERAGVPRSVAMRLTGHKTEAVYRRYAIVAKCDLEEGVAKLAKLHANGAAG